MALLLNVPPGHTVDCPISEVHNIYGYISFIRLAFAYPELRALQLPSAGGVSPVSGLRGSPDDRSGSSKTKARLVRRLSASSAMIAAAPVDAPSESYRSYIEQIPPEDGPQMFGMHASVRKRPVVTVHHATVDSVSYCITYSPCCTSFMNFTKSL